MFPWVEPPVGITRGISKTSRRKAAFSVFPEEERCWWQQANLGVGAILESSWTAKQRLTDVLASAAPID